MIALGRANEAAVQGMHKDPQRILREASVHLKKSTQAAKLARRRGGVR